MGFLRKYFVKDWNDVNLQLQAFDQRISAIEGIHGQYSPKANIDSDNKSRLTNLTAPTMPHDAARYTDSVRSRTYVHSVGGGATLLFNMNYIAGQGYTSGAPGWTTNYYKLPANMEFKSLYINAGQISATVGANYWIRGTLLADYGGALTTISSTTVFAVNGLAGYPVAGETTAVRTSGKTLNKGDRMFMQITTSGSARWIDAAMLINFNVIDI